MKRLFVLGILFLAGCAAGAQTRSASINVDALLRVHPLYGTLGQYDRQIAVLESTLHTQFSDSGTQIEHAGAAIRRDLSNAAHVTVADRNILARNRTAPNVPSGASNVQAPQAGAVEAGILQNYDRQHAELQSVAQGDMDRYRSTLLAQQQNAYEAFVRSVNDRTQRAYRCPRAGTARKRIGAAAGVGEARRAGASITAREAGNARAQRRCAGASAGADAGHTSARRCRRRFDAPR